MENDEYFLAKDDIKKVLSATTQNEIFAIDHYLAFFDAGTTNTYLHIA